MKPHRTTITCHGCAGKGRVELPEHLEETLAAIRKPGTPVPLKVVRQAVGQNITAAAVSMRIADLIRHGLVHRHKQGGRFIYTATPDVSKAA